MGTSDRVSCAASLAPREKDLGFPGRTIGYSDGLSAKLFPLAANRIGACGMLLRAACDELLKATRRSGELGTFISGVGKYDTVWHYPEII